jgi:hypothetical protein
MFEAQKTDGINPNFQIASPHLFDAISILLVVLARKENKMVQLDV